ncbi:ATP-grasp domain-containing protein [Bacillus cereus]|nr:ATP-grasp domain-containing protein [Bacillus cereus]
MKGSSWILTIGSKRQSKELAKYISKYNISVHHIVEEESEWIVKPYNEILKQVESVISDSVCSPLAIINLGRSTVPKGIELIAKCSQEIKLKFAKYLMDTKIIGPTYAAARIFNDKWLTYKVLRDNHFLLPYTEKLKIVDNHLDTNLSNFPFPAVFKLTALTGGAGMVYIEQEQELLYKINKFKTEKFDRIISEFIQGYEFSIVVLSLGENVLVHPIGLKAPTSIDLTHVDNKIKVNGYLKNIECIENDVIKLVKQFNIQGHFTLEGIIISQEPFSYVVLETATRITGSFQISNASLGFNPFEAIGKYVLGMEWLPKEKRQNISISIPIYKHNYKSTIQALKKYSWIIDSRLDELEKMPFSIDKRTRITVGLIIDHLLIEKLNILQMETGDFTIINRVKQEFVQLNHAFPEMISERVQNEPLLYTKSSFL